MNLSDLFRSVETEPQEFDSDRDAYCSCPGTSRNVLVCIEDGRISGVKCADCSKPLLFGGMEDDFELISASKLPMVMTTVDEWESVNEGYTYERYDAYRLTLAENEATA